MHGNQGMPHKIMKVTDILHEEARPCHREQFFTKVCKHYKKENKMIVQEEPSHAAMI